MGGFVDIWSFWTLAAVFSGSALEGVRTHRVLCTFYRTFLHLPSFGTKIFWVNDSINAAICKHHSAKLYSVTELIGEYRTAEAELQHLFSSQVEFTCPSLQSFWQINMASELCDLVSPSDLWTLSGLCFTPYTCSEPTKSPGCMPGL